MALQAKSSKKGLKLSKRKNAIILALELETALMSKDCDKRHGLSPEKANAAGLPEEYAHKIKRKRSLSHTEDDGNDSSEGIKKRMRGPSSLGDLCRFNHLPIVNGSGGVCMAYIKKKRSNVLFQEFLKQEDSIDSLTKAQSNTLVSVPIIYDELPRVSCQNAPFKSASAQAQGFPPRITRSSVKPQIDALANEAQIESDSAQEKTEKDPLVWQMKGKRNPRHQSRNPGLDCKKPTDSKADLSDPGDQLDRYEIPEPSISHVNAESVVCDVHIKVEASYRPQNVPSISLMSILNRKPVSGHPISVEVLEDGESDFMSELDEDYKPTETGTRLYKTQKPGSLTRKTRTLSSMAESRTKNRPTFACIPVKILFSRIHEALNGSISTGNRVS